MDTEATRTSLPVGKLRRLAALADHDGRFQIVSAEGRGGLGGDFAPSLTAAAAQSLSTQASAVILDPRCGLPHAAFGLDRGAALVVAVGVDGDQPALLDGWSVAKCQRLGAAAVHLRVPWPAAEATLDLVQMVGDECAKHEMPFLLEVDAVGGDDGALLRLPEAVAQLTAAEAQVDLLCLGLPVALAEVREFAAGAFDGQVRGAAAELATLASALDGVTQASGAPWVVTGGGETSGERLAAVTLACAHGASGFLWPGDTALPADLDPSRIDGWLLDEGVYNLRRAVVSSERAQPWYGHPRHAEAPPVQHATEWYARY